MLHSIFIISKIKNGKFRFGSALTQPRSLLRKSYTIPNFKNMACITSIYSRSQFLLCINTKLPLLCLPYFRTRLTCCRDHRYEDPSNVRCFDVLRRTSSITKNREYLDDDVDASVGLTAAEFDGARLPIHRVLVEDHVAGEGQRQALAVEYRAVRRQADEPVRNGDRVK